MTKKIVIGWGRLNPPTQGHLKMVKSLIATAKRENAVGRLYLSHTQNDDKDPLTYEQKVKYCKSAFGNIVYKTNDAHIFKIAKGIYEEGFTDLILVVGEDRVEEFKQKLLSFNGKRDYTFNTIEVINAGDRNASATDVTGMSASKVRAWARDGDWENFEKGIAPGLSEKEKREIYEIIRGKK